jgi:hypothetical protein
MSPDRCQASGTAATILCGDPLGNSGKNSPTSDGREVRYSNARQPARQDPRSGSHGVRWSQNTRRGSVPGGGIGLTYLSLGSTSAETRITPCHRPLVHTQGRGGALLVLSAVAGVVHSWPRWGGRSQGQDTVCAGWRSMPWRGSRGDSEDDRRQILVSTRGSPEGLAEEDRPGQRLGPCGLEWIGGNGVGKVPASFSR